MATFNFDSETNVVSKTTPSVKAINKYFCGKRGSSGFWIADENMEACNWRKECNSKCDPKCVEHFANTKEHRIQASEDEIIGRGIVDYRICVLRRTPLIKITSDKGIYSGLWVKGDGEIKDDKGKKKYSYARRYLLVFLDENNEPLHEQPIQWTAKGTFQMDFDNNLLKFREEIKNSYAKAMKRRCGQMNELWFAMCVFNPTFESKMVGKSPLRSEACSVKNFTIPTENNWLELCVGRNQKVNEIINLMYMDTEKWMSRFDKNNMISSDFEDNMSIISE